jgi:hypothetical protein
MVGCVMSDTLTAGSHQRESSHSLSPHGPPQMSQCDGILEHMEQLLGRFQSDLGKVSDEIRALQVQSQAMSTRLRNRRAIENKLGAFVEAMAVPEDMIAGIMEAEVGWGEGGRGWMSGRVVGLQDRLAPLQAERASSALHASQHITPHSPTNCMPPPKGQRGVPGAPPGAGPQGQVPARRRHGAGQPVPARRRGGAGEASDQGRHQGGGGWGGRARCCVGKRVLGGGVAGTAQRLTSWTQRSATSTAPNRPPPPPGPRVPPGAPLPAAQAQDQHLHHPAERAAQVQVLCALRTGARGGHIRRGVCVGGGSVTWFWLKSN